MNLLAKLKRRFLRVLLVLSCFLILAATVLYLLVIYRCKDGVRYLINKEFNGSYSFDASEVTVSLWQGYIRLKDSKLQPTDTTGSDLYFSVRIPEIYFSLASWKELILHKKVMVDSLSIIEPFIDVHTHQIPALHASAVKRPSDLLNYLQKALDRLNVHSFTLKDAAFSYQRMHTREPLHGDHISLSIANFAVINNEDSHLLGSDNLSLSLGPQHWTLPDGKHQIDFSRLSFDSKGQRFVLDSFYFYQQADTGKTFMAIRADQFLFSSQHLPAIYQKEQLLLDSLICINPVLSLPGGNTKTGKDSASAARIKSDLFNLINVRYISVINGELLLQDKGGRTGNASTEKANLDIFNLTIRPSVRPALTTDSIRLGLKKLEFRTKDSLYKLTIDEFSFRQNDVLFKDVRFGPSSPLPLDKKVEFTAPSLLLKDISLADLLQGRIVATDAALSHPVITLYDRRREGHITTRRGPIASAKQLALIYRTLHHVNELIHAGDFYLIDGTASYVLSGGIPVRAGLEHLNAHILLNSLFVSDSLVDIKHAIPDLRISDMNLVSGKTTIRIKGFSFDGKGQHTRSQKVTISTAGGSQLTGENIYWNVFDWDAFQQRRDIRIDSLSASRCTLHVVPPQHTSRNNQTSPELPVVRIGKLRIDELTVDYNTPAMPVQLGVSGLHADHLRSMGAFFAWDHLNMHLHDLHGENGKSTASIKAIDFDSDKELLIKDLEFSLTNQQTRARISVPRFQLQTKLLSTDVSRFSVDSLTGNAILSYSKTSATDTLDAAAVAEIRGKDLVLKDKGLLAKAFSIRWKDVRLDYHKENTSLALKDMTGSFDQDNFAWSPATKLSLRSILTRLTIDQGQLGFESKKITANAGALAWHPSDSSLRVSRFSVSPRDSRAQTFSKSKWQQDFITVQGNDVTVTGIRLSPDRLFPDRASHVILDGIKLQASRDKNMPFQHGLEKLMPTRLLNTLPFPVRVDTVSIRSTNVTYNECSILTGRWSSVTIGEINGSILHLSSRNNERDTLQVSARGRLFDGHIRDFSYREAYGDSLSSFSARSRISAIDLTQFSQVSIPAAAVSITGGHADTSWANWQGNKYFTFGTMHLFYDNLKIKVLNRKDSTKRGLLPALETWAANLILPGHRKRPAVIFVERDREKFVFNYWVKAQVSGVLSTLNLKNGSAYKRLYQKDYQLYLQSIRSANSSPDWPPLP
jgi:hypothetical protein